MRKRVLDITCIVLCIAILSVLIWYMNYEKHVSEKEYTDGIEQIDLNSIRLDDSGVTVDFTEVIVGKHEETRKLVVSTQEATVSIELTERVIEKLDFEFLKKTQTVSYTGTGYFVVNLDEISRADIVEDKKNKIITIKIGDAELETIEMDPNKIIIDEVKEGLLARGDINLTVSDYNAIEKELRDKLETKFNTVKNGQEANEIALRMVKEIYEPIIKAVDPRYKVQVEFR